MYHLRLKSVVWLLVSLGAGAVLSWITDTPYPAIAFFALALIATLLLVFWPKISEYRLKAIRDKLQMGVSEVVGDAKYRRVRVTFSVACCDKHVSLKSFDKALVRLDTKEVSEMLQLEETVQLIPPSTKIKASFAILPESIKYLLSKKRAGEEVYWEFSPESRTRCLLYTRWGETIWVPKIEPFRRIPRIG